MAYLGLAFGGLLVLLSIVPIKRAETDRKVRNRPILFIGGALITALSIDAAFF